MKELLEDKCSDFFEDYPETSSVSIQVAWLRSLVPDSIDPDLYECILKKHQITGEKYDKYIEDYWGDVAPVFTEIKIQDIKNDYFSFPINYDFYISFPFSLDYKISHHLASNFTLKPSCYSLPFMEAIYRLYKNDAILVFTMGKYEGNDTLVFSIKESTDSFFDFSQIPPLVPPKEPYAI